jgi:hypothetical protein
MLAARVRARQPVPGNNDGKSPSKVILIRVHPRPKTLFSWFFMNNPG